MKRKTASPDTEPGEFADEELHSSRIDQFKAQIDVLKHIATLDTAALLVIVAFVEKVIATPRHKFLIGLAVLSLLASLLASGLACLSALQAFPRAGARRMAKEDRRDRLVATGMTFLGFIVGIGLLAMFFSLNWFS